MATLTSDEVEALLGRSLTSVESANFDLYLEIAEIRIEDILCTSLDDLLTTLGVDALPTDLQLVVAQQTVRSSAWSPKRLKISLSHSILILTSTAS